MADNEKKLIELLRFVTNHNPFYIHRIKEYGIANPLDISQWPVLTRDELQSNRYKMFSEGYKEKYYNQQLKRQSSSGSSGVPIDVYWNPKDWMVSNLCLWRKRLEWYQVKPNDKFCIFTLVGFDSGVQKHGIEYVIDANRLWFNVSHIQNELGYENIVKVINQFEPDWLYIQPFVLREIIRAFRRIELKPTKAIKYIESVGELLPSSLKEEGEAFFGVKITNMYGSEEMNGIAIDHPTEGMSVLTDNVFLEVKTNRGIGSSGCGESIITNLNNYAMPLIRYEQGDIVRLDNSKLTPMITQVIGRTIDVVRTDLGIILSESLLMELMSMIINQFPYTISLYHFFYDNSGSKLTCYISLVEGKKSWFGAVKKEILALFIEKRVVESFDKICVFLEDETIVLSGKRRVFEVVY